MIKVTQENLEAAENRGSADAYYGRPHRPHLYIQSGPPKDRRVELDRGKLWDAYSKGYNEEEYRKDWG